MNFKFLFLVSLIGTFLLLGCSDTPVDDPVKIHVSEIRLDKETLELTVGETYRLIATVLPDNAEYDAVIWDSSDREVATVDQNGHVTAQALGETTVTAKAGGKEAVCKVSVVDIPVESVTVRPETLELKVGETEQLTATVLPENADNKSVKWSSDKPEIATVSEEGLVTAVAGGEAKITAKAGEKTADCIVTVTEDPKVVTVYGTGYYDKLIWAFHWKTGDDGPQDLSKDSGQSLRTSSIFVSGSDVYIGGQATTDDRGYFAPTIWKNGEPTFLTDPTAPIDGEVQSLFVDGNDVYGSGFYRRERTPEAPFLRDVATIWKNGTEIQLTDGSTYAQARAIYVSNGTVYAAGENTNSAGTAVVTLWSNDSDDWSKKTVKNLSDGTNHAYAESIWVSGNDVYVAGYGYGSGSAYRAMLWKNDEPVQFLSNNQSFAYSVCVANGHVYVAGWDYLIYDGTECAVATLWVDGEPQYLDTDKRSSQARDLFVLGENIYVSGFLGDHAVIWENGTPMRITDGTLTAAITSVFVTEN